MLLCTYAAMYVIVAIKEMHMDLAICCEPVNSLIGENAKALL